MNCARNSPTFSRCSSKSDGHGRAGWALVSVLWTLAMLAMMAAAVEAITLTAARFEHTVLVRTQLEADIDAGVARAVLGISDPRPQQRWRVDGAVENFLYHGDAIAVSVQDENGRVDLNHADLTVLRRLLTSEGVAQAGKLADNIAAWRTPPGDDAADPVGATAAEYEAAGLAYRPRRGPFQSVSELNLMLGMTPELYARLAPDLTVYSHAADVDLSVAPPAVLAALSSGATPHRPAAATPLIAGSSTPPGPPGTVGDVTNLAGHSFDITVVAMHGRQRLSRDVVVEFTDDKRHPYLVEAWRQPDGMSGP
ncbi:MAG: general secretion pathway protein GspK [Alphaproteobacteria bacterium]|nr:general secretion pathway protein GspK [Alphaproteobacteria bacterium]